MRKLTATKIEKHKPIENDERLPDGNGLYIRFRKGQSGNLSRSWMYTYKVGTKSVYMTLGDYDASLPDFESSIYKLSSGAKLTLENARKIAAELKDWRKRGLDPKEFLQQEIDRLAAEAKAKAEAEALLQKKIEVERLTVKDMFDAWITVHVRRKDGNAELQRSFKADVLPKIGKKTIKDLSEHDLRGVLSAMVARGVNRTAVIMRNNLTQMFIWAEKRQPWRKLMAEGNPMALIEIKEIVSPDYDMNNQRNRILSADEIRELRDIFKRIQDEYNAAPNKRSTAQPVEQTTQCAIWIMLSTLCRVGELSMARWEHVDFDTGKWFIPKENVKGNLDDLTVYLSDFTLTHFRQLEKITGKSEWCFPAKNKDNTHVCQKSMSKQIGDRQSMFKKSKDGTPRKPMKNRRHDNTLVLGEGKNGAWTPHDLRRTGATMMQSLGVSLDIIDRCQNHVLAGSKVRRHYMHHDYAQEKREAWALLGEQISNILNASNVVPLQPAI
ncbi:MAG TPA: tyrosine-type recombinase/integrase [Burkholderiaceae bacterium]|nr:tyrosine-type recombinase/integrase [Burkholderiaceae bacterium]